jgi:hypothetical protein
MTTNGLEQGVMEVFQTINKMKFAKIYQNCLL